MLDDSPKLCNIRLCHTRKRPPFHIVVNYEFNHPIVYPKLVTLSKLILSSVL